MQQIFISYAQDQSHGQRLAKQVQQQLHEQGFRVFRDETGVIAGMQWVKEIESQLKASQLVVLVVSSKVQHSEWVFAEFQMARNMGIPIVPVLAERLPDLPLWLLPLQHLNFSHQPNWQLLIQAIASHIQMPKEVTVPAILTSSGYLTEQTKPVWANTTGNDEYGYFSDLDIGGIVQRFRQISAGVFWMGSPATEPERSDCEVRHKVTLTKNFWLADTVCTQAMWKVVLGHNPAWFKDSGRNPVERVSWEDVQEFIQTLNSLIPSLYARLPTEGEWEYACRADTNTPFSFGDNITSEEVNYDGNTPYSGGRKGVYREKTVPVKSFPANKWGLYEMHGNVWEWCQDAWMENLAIQPMVDPLVDSGVLVSDAKFKRVVRGGSWWLNAGDVRSATRIGELPTRRHEGIGFRLAISDANQVKLWD